MSMHLKSLVLASSLAALAACGGGGGGSSSATGSVSSTAAASAAASVASSQKTSASSSAVSAASLSSLAASQTASSSATNASSVASSLASSVANSSKASSVASSAASSLASSVASSAAAASSQASSAASSKSSAASSAASSATSSVAASSAQSSAAVSSAASTSALAYHGVSLAIAEFGANSDGSGTLPGTINSTYAYPTNAEVDYFVGKGMNTLRLPFRWERLQRTLGGAFDSTELAAIDSFVSYATAKGAYVVLDPHNYARYYQNLIGSSSVTQAHFADLWSRLATRYKGNNKVIFALVNEPYGIDSTVWLNAANAAIASIRATGSSNLILVPGIAWTGAHSWVSSGNSTTMLGIVDSGNNYAFEVHQYLDGDSSGTSTTCVSATIGAERLAVFTAWLKANGKKGFLGELAGANNTTCQAAITGQLQYLKDNSGVWLGWTWWAAGAWWGEYMYTLEPTNSFTTDRPQMSWLTPFL